MSEAPSLEASPRARLELETLAAAEAGSPRLQVITAPRGLGKTEMLRRLEERLAARGLVTARLDFERACTIPTDFAPRFVAAIAEAAGRRGRRPGPRAEHLARALAEETARARPDAAFLLDAALSYPRALAEDLQAPVTLLVDELGEVQRLARHSRLRDCLPRVARALASAEGVRIVATASPASRPAPLLKHLRAEAPENVSVAALPPMAPDEIARALAAWGCPSGASSGPLDLWVRATDGRPLYARILARGCAAGQGLEQTLARELSAPMGLLHQECRFDYHLLIERSRGQAAVRTILELIARDGGMNLSAIARHLKVTLPTALDYLSWLLEVELIRRDGGGYRCADPLLGLWVAVSDLPEDRARARVAEFLRLPPQAPAPPHRPRGRRPGTRAVPPAPPAPAVPAPRRRDLLIEID